MATWLTTGCARAHSVERSDSSWMEHNSISIFSGFSESSSAPSLPFPFQNLATILTICHTIPIILVRKNLALDQLITPN